MVVFPIQDQIYILTPLQNFRQIIQAMVKSCTIHRKIIHEDFDYVFNKVGKDSYYASLKSGGALHSPNDILLQ